MNTVLQTLLRGAAIAAVLVASAGAAAADDYPNRPVRLVVPFPPGGGVDSAGRAVAAMLSDAFRYPTVVENKTGAVGAIGYELAARAAPDGYTLLMGSATPLMLTPLVKHDLPYKLSDYAPVSLVASVPHVLVVTSSLPAKNLQEFIDYSKKAPAPPGWGSAGAGTVHYMAGELFFAATGASGLQVAYRGSGQMMPDLLSGQIQAASLEINTAIPYVKAGSLRALGIAAAERSPMLPDVPTMAELGLSGFEVTSWFGVVVPKGVPAPIVAKLSEALRKRTRSDEYAKAFQGLGATPIGSTPEEFTAFIGRETEKWTGLIKRAKQ
ncbi:MAG: Bug family tripartite tricarboxylate transporter substrate binding protein [Lautropia sp.]